MKKLRLLAAGLPLGALAILAVAGAPAASAAPAAHVTVFAGQDMLSPNSGPFCPTTNDEYVPGQKYHVNADNIHIRNAPDGNTILYAISKTAVFISTFPGSQGETVRCISDVKTGPPDSGIRWVYGWSQAHTDHIGWVGLPYLS